MKRLAFVFAATAAFVAACGDNSSSPTAATPEITPRAVLTAGPVSGAIFTTDVACNGTNVNIFGAKSAVYLDGGPAHPGAAGLPDGEYYVQVTTPNGDLLGTSIGTADETPAVVVGGEFAACYQLSVILKKASDGTPGFDNTTNSGGEYKVWVSKDPGFANSASKTDNFKVFETPEPPPTGRLNVVKFYDANANGINDDGQPITGWKVRIQDGIDFIRFTPASLIVTPDDYTVTEFMPTETNWVGTTLNPVLVALGAGEEKTVSFGNVCLGAGGGHTLGFWSNKNGQETMNDGGSMTSELALLGGLNLRNAAGANFDPANYNGFRSWLLNATATNMAYMLSAQLAAMELNVEAGMVSGGALVYAPALIGSPANENALGFISINDLKSAANAELGANGLVLSDHPSRPYQEALKTALDRANNNLNFVQATACAFTFAE
ncbi:MAG TPA: hypothetical protein VF746_23755 [Longimicrobium sp.]|jgi:hypothetical protein